MIKKNTCIKPYLFSNIGATDKVIKIVGEASGALREDVGAINKVIEILEVVNDTITVIGR